MNMVKSAVVALIKQVERHIQIEVPLTEACFMGDLDQI